MYANLTMYRVKVWKWNKEWNLKMVKWVINFIYQAVDTIYIVLQQHPFSSNEVTTAWCIPPTTPPTTSIRTVRWSRITPSRQEKFCRFRGYSGGLLNPSVMKVLYKRPEPQNLRFFFFAEDIERKCCHGSRISISVMLEEQIAK